MSWKPYDETSFPHNLRCIRERREMTQQELGDFARLAASQISNFECGERAPSLANLVKLCLALDCSPNDLLQP